MSFLAPLKVQWRAMAAREQNFVLGAATLVGLAVAWWVAIAPALQTLRTAPARHAVLDTQLQRMRGLQAEAQQLQAAPRTSTGDSVGALRNDLTQRLGTAAQLNVAGDRATVTLKAAPADALAQWLAIARSNARAVPIEAHLTRSTATAAAPARSMPAAPAAPAPAPGAQPTATGGPLMPPIPGAMPPMGTTTVAAAPVGAATTPRWDGTLVLSLPAR